MTHPTLALLALLALGACSSTTEAPPAPSCGGEEVPLNPELWDERQNDIAPGRGGRRAR